MITCFSRYAKCYFFFFFIEFLCNTHKLTINEFTDFTLYLDWQTTHLNSAHKILRYYVPLVLLFVYRPEYGISIEVETSDFS